MKKFNKKSLVLLIAAALLLTVSVGSTVAYLTAGTDELVNEFTPTSVDITVTDTVENNIKKMPTITNTSDIPVYIRVAIVAYWMNGSDTVVAPWNQHEDLWGKTDGIDTTEWDRGTDGYYYYKEPVEAGESIVLFKQYAQPTPPVGVGENVHLEMDILAQAIQAEPTSVVADTWGVTVNSDKTISK